MTPWPPQDLFAHFPALPAPPRTDNRDGPTLSFQAFPNTVPPAPNALHFLLLLFLYSCMMPSQSPSPQWSSLSLSYWDHIQESCKEHKCDWGNTRRGTPPSSCSPPTGITDTRVYVNGAPGAQAFKFALQKTNTPWPGCLNSPCSVPNLSPPSLNSENLKVKTGIQSPQKPVSQLLAQLAED